MSVRRKRVFNVRLLAGTLIAASVVGVAAYFWRSYQVNRTAATFLERAAVLEEEEEWNEAAGYVSRYLELHPDDVDALVRFTDLFAQSAKDPRRKRQAINQHYRTLGIISSSDIPDAQAEEVRVRSQLGQLLLDIGGFASAEAEAKKILAVDDKNPQGIRLLALALYGQFRVGALAPKPGDKPAVGEIFEQAVKLNPGDIRLAPTLARIYREKEQLLSDEKRELTDTERQQLADKIIDGMVAADPQNSEVRLARYFYRTEHDAAGAEEDLRGALKYGPDNLTVLLVAADHTRRKARRAGPEEGSLEETRKRYAKARKYYERAIQIEPADERAYLGLGQVYLAQREPERAIETWQRGLAQTDKKSLPLNLHLAETLIARGQLNQAEQTLEVLDHVMKKLGPRLPPPMKTALERSNDFLRAKWLMAKGTSRDYIEAVSLLRRVALGRRNIGSEVTQAFQAWQLIGSVYVALRRWDQAALAYEQAATLRPNAAQPHLKAAAAWVNANRPESAVRHYEQGLAIEDNRATWLSLARARFQCQLRLPKGERNWELFSKALAEVKTRRSNKPSPQDWDAALLEANYMAVTAGKPENGNQGISDAVKLLRQTENRHSKSPNLLAKLVSAYEQLGFPADADRALERFETLVDKSATAYLLRAGLYARREQYERAREVLHAGLEALPSTKHTPLQYELIQIDLREGRFEQAQNQLSKLHEKDPSNTAVICQLAEHTLETRDAKDARRWEKKLRKLEGPNGLYWRYYEARRLLIQAEGPEDADLTRAAELQAWIQSERPEWPAAYLLGGLVFQRQGKFEQAVEAYQQAIRLGQQRISVYERLIFLLNQMGRIAEADQYLSRLQEHAAASERLSSLQMTVAARLGQLDRAVEVARRAVERRPEDAMARVRLGQMLLADDKPAEAKAAFQKAVDLAPADVRTYNALFICQLRANQTDDARKTVEELAQRAELPEDRRAFVLAQAYERLGDREKAEAGYREAQRLAPDSVAVQMRLADLLVRGGKVDEARKLLRRVVQMEPRYGNARRRLAAVLAAQGGEKEWQEAQQLLEEAGAEENESSPDRRLQAMLLVSRGGEENFGKARRLLESLIADSAKSVDGDRALLARVYEDEGKLQAARGQYVSLVSRAEPNASHLVLYIDLLLRHDYRDEAVVWLKRLEKIAPDDAKTVSLRARWLHGEGRSSEIEPLVEPFAKKRWKEAAGLEREARLALDVGNLYTAVQQHAAAERWYKRLKELMPDRYDALAMSLTQQGRTAEAIRLCIEAAKSDGSPRPAILMTRILSSGSAGKEDFQLAEPIFSKTLQSHPENVELLFNIASVRVVQQRTENAVQFYRRVLRLEPNHILALNNLATLLSEDTDTRKQSQEYVTRALKIAGPQPRLLDTKGMILVYQGKAAEAVPLLEKAASTANPDPRYHFHLAVAYHRVGETDKARNALNKAIDGDLEKSILTEADRKLRVELEQELRLK